MTCLYASLVAMALAVLSGVCGLARGSAARAGERLADVSAVSAGVVGAGAALVALHRGTIATAAFGGPLPELRLSIRLDPLSSFFLVPIHVLGAAAAIYGTQYWSRAEHPATAPRVRLWLGVLVASLAGVVLAADGFAFLVAWEIMALMAFLLITTEHERSEVRQAGWVYLVTTHAGTLVLFAVFGLLWMASGSLALDPLPADAGRSGTVGALFMLAFLAFGTKAGVAPLHFWLPAAHSTAPSHVSALLSGVVLKMGIYGLLRILAILPPPPAAVGMILLGMGVGSALYGVLFALGQHDLKRLLAYHSVENIGIIVIGMGLALIGVRAGQPAWVALGLGGCLLHVWNHALFKGLLFLAAGSVIHAAGTREIDRLGGLAKRMGATASLFAIGAAAICGLPPLNGFVSELLLYAGLFRVGADGIRGPWAVAPLAAPMLAMAGALAIACFVKVFGTVFLGPSRSEPAMHAHESPRAMRAAMTALALGCIGIGVLPVLAMPLLDRVVAAWMPHAVPAPAPRLGALLPWAPLMALAATGIVLAASIAALLRARSIRDAARTVTWDCGYARPTARMAYTASSFAEILVGLHRWLLAPRMANPQSDDLFPAPRAFQTHVPERVLDGLLVPLWTGVRRALTPIRVVQRGRIQLYLVYVFLTLCLLVAASFPVGELVARALRW